MKVLTSSPKQQEDPPKITETKEEIRLKQMKRRVKRAYLEWNDSVLQGQLKSLMYTDRSLCDYPKKDKLINE